MKIQRNVIITEQKPQDGVCCDYCGSGMQAQQYQITMYTKGLQSSHRTTWHACSQDCLDEIKVEIG